MSVAMIVPVLLIPDFIKRRYEANSLFWIRLSVSLCSPLVSEPNVHDCFYRSIRNISAVIDFTCSRVSVRFETCNVCICDSKLGVIKNVPVTLLLMRMCKPFNTPPPPPRDQYYAKSSKTVLDGYKKMEASWGHTTRGLPDLHLPLSISVTTKKFHTSAYQRQ